MEKVAAEIEIRVDRYGVDFIGFADDNMMASENRIMAFCDLMEQKKFPITRGCHGRDTSANPEVFNRMVEAGIYSTTTLIFGYPGEPVETIQGSIALKSSL